MSVFSQKNIFDFLFYFTIKMFHHSGRPYLTRSRALSTVPASMRNRLGDEAAAPVPFPSVSLSAANHFRPRHFLTCEKRHYSLPLYIYVILYIIT